MEILNCRPGPVIGTTLSQLFSEVEEGKLPNVRDQQRARIGQLKTKAS
jgi:hypothetical protein